MGRPVSKTRVAREAFDVEADGEIRLCGTRGSASAYAIRDFLHRSDIPFRWVELSGDEHARNEAGVASVGDERLPVCIFPDGTRLERPTIRQITEKLGWFQNPSRTDTTSASTAPVPAGLSAAVYGASEGLEDGGGRALGRRRAGRQQPQDRELSGLPAGISGAELAERAREQACASAPRSCCSREGVRGEFLPGKGIGYLADGTKIIARA